MSIMNEYVQQPFFISTTIDNSFWFRYKPRWMYSTRRMWKMDCSW
jgi:hypothetical protein